MFIEDIVITIKLSGGEMKVSAPSFITSDNFTVPKMKRMAEICKISDRDFGTDSAKEFCHVCDLVLNKKLGLIRMTDKLRKKLENFQAMLMTPLPKPPKKQYKLF